MKKTLLTIIAASQLINLGCSKSELDYQFPIDPKDHLSYKQSIEDGKLEDRNFIEVKGKNHVMVTYFFGKDAQLDSATIWGSSDNYKAISEFGYDHITYANEEVFRKAENAFTIYKERISTLKNLNSK